MNYDRLKTDAWSKFKTALPFCITIRDKNFENNIVNIFQHFESWGNVVSLTFFDIASNYFCYGNSLPIQFQCIYTKYFELALSVITKKTIFQKCYSEFKNANIYK